MCKRYYEIRGKREGASPLLEQKANYNSSRIVRRIASIIEQLNPARG
jgi:hypothetical protein